MKTIMKKIRFIEPNPSHEKTKMLVMKEIVYESFHMQTDLRNNKMYPYANWKKVEH